MAETQNTPTEAENFPPYYVEYAAKEREQFLSDIGNFSLPQQEIFQTLCKIWQPEIPYARFLSQVSGAIKNVTAELDKLMERLSERKCGLIKIHYSLGEEVRDSVILTAPNSIRYYYFRLLNELEIFFGNIEPNIPDEEYLESRGLRPPVVRNLGEDSYSFIFEEAKKGDYTIFRIHLPTQKSLLLPGGGGIRLINYCLAKLREALSRTNLSMEIARLMEIPMSELKKRGESKDPLLILGIAKAVQEVKNDPLAFKRVQAAPVFFQTTAILAHLIKCNVDDMKRKKDMEEDRLRDMNALALLLEQEKELIISEKRFGEVMATFNDKYPSGLDSFRREFAAKFVEFKDDTKIPVLIFINKSYIHRNHFYQLFLSHLYVFRDAADTYTLKTMENILRTGNRERKTIFYSRENFESELMDYLRSTDPLLAEIFAAPRILSEAIMYTFKEKRKIRDLNLTKEELEKYFRSDTMQFKSLPVILKLSISDIFQRAFFRLAWWRQLILKATGKYASYQDQYTRLGAAQGGSPSRKSQGGSRAAGNDYGLPDGPGDSSGAARRRRKGSQNVKKRGYSKRQQENAWSQFSKTIKPK
jgi:hypothetical protein